MEPGEEQYQKLYDDNFKRAYLAASIMPAFMESVLNMSETFEPVQQGILDGIKKRFADVRWGMENPEDPHAQSRSFENGYLLGDTIARFCQDFVPMLDKVMPAHESPLLEGIAQGVRHGLEGKLRELKPYSLERRLENNWPTDREAELSKKTQPSKDQDIDR